VVGLNDLRQFRLRTACNRMLDLVPQRMRGSIDYHLGHHTVFYPQGGPMNGQTARLEIVRTLIIALRPALFVEIGTFRGSTTEWLAQFGPRVVSVETSPRFHRFSQLRLGARKNVRLMPGNSVDALRQLAGEGAFAEGTVLFYLNSREQSHALLREELEFIFTNCASCLVVVDDFQVEGDVDYAFGHFGPDKALTTDYLAACELPNLAIFFPAVPGRRETGERRGSVFLTASPDVARVIEATQVLRPWRMPRDAGRVDRSSPSPSDRAVRSSRPRLADVALCCIDCAQPELAIRALRISRAHCDFAATVLFTNADMAEEGIEIHRIPRIADRTAYSHFVLKELPTHVATPFVLVVQWDGYVLDGARWEDGFRQFDYIGAPWNWRGAPRKVGTGGFSLRSRRLLEMVKDVAIPPGPQAEDDLICNVWRPMLEQRGIRFADVVTARRFSVEMERTEAPSFGFHGLYNFWRSVPAEELEGLLRSMSRAQAMSKWMAVLILEYARQRRWTEANLALTCYERQLGTAKTVQALTEVSPDVGAVVYDAIRRLDAGRCIEARGH
jgi:predicted O-methyltransferase YrrM